MPVTPDQITDQERVGAEKSMKDFPAEKVGAIVQQATYAQAHALRQQTAAREKQQAGEMEQAASHSVIRAHEAMGRAQEQGEQLFHRTQQEIAQKRHQKDTDFVPEPTTARLPRTTRLS